MSEDIKTDSKNCEGYYYSKEYSFKILERLLKGEKIKDLNLTIVRESVFDVNNTEEEDKINCVWVLIIFMLFLEAYKYLKKISVI